jgi:hypothetical protein
MAEDIVSVHQGSGTLAQAVLASAPEGMLIAPVWKRVAAYMLDVVLLSVVLGFITQGRLLFDLLNFELLTAGPRYAVFFFVNWFILLASNYLYFKWTGRTIGRSLAQRGFRIAIVHDNGTPLEDHHWGPRAVAKMVYLIPIIGPLWFGLRDVIRGRSKESEYRTSVDKAHHTVAAVDWSLPSETRLRLR